MPRKPRAFVLDSWAVMAYFEDEPAASQVEELLVSAHEGAIPILMSVVNVGEIWYLVARKTSPTEADRAVEDLIQLGIEVVSADWAITREAARFKSTQRMSYADCYAAALAASEKADLLTGDPEFRPIEGQVRVHWLSG